MYLLDKTGTLTEALLSDDDDQIVRPKAIRLYHMNRDSKTDDLQII